MRGDLHYPLPAVRASTKHNVAFATWPRPIDGAPIMTSRAQWKGQPLLRLPAQTGDSCDKFAAYHAKLHSRLRGPILDVGYLSETSHDQEVHAADRCFGFDPVYGNKCRSPEKAASDHSDLVRMRLLA